MSNTYTLGTQITLTATFTDAAGVLTNPTSTTAKIRLPDGSQTALTPLVNGSTGVFTFAYTPLSVGLYIYQFAGTGAVVVAGESTFLIHSIF